MNHRNFNSADIPRQLDNLVQVTTISSVDPANKTLRVKLGDEESAELPWPADQGANYTRWKPLKVGQQVVISSPTGDPAQAVITGQLYCDEHDSPSTDPDIDVIQFTNGSRIEHNINTGVLDFTGFSDVRVNGISIPFHVHDKVRVGTEKSGKPQ